jgi:hypothetical protein
MSSASAAMAAVTAASYVLINHPFSMWRGGSAPDRNLGRSLRAEFRASRGDAGLLKRR